MTSYAVTLANAQRDAPAYGVLSMSPRAPIDIALPDGGTGPSVQDLRRLVDAQVASVSSGTEGLDLSVVIPYRAGRDGVARTMAELRPILTELGIRHESLVVVPEGEQKAAQEAIRQGARVVQERGRTLGELLRRGIEAARGAYVLTLDDRFAGVPQLVRELWERRSTADITVASRYPASSQVPNGNGGSLWSLATDRLLSRALSLPVRDISSDMRLYKTSAVRGYPPPVRGADPSWEVLVRACADGWSLQEVSASHATCDGARPRPQARHSGLARLRSLWALWRLRNSIQSADYDDRAYDSAIFLQRYWQRSRFRHISDLLPRAEGRTLDVGCGSSRIIRALPPNSVALDILAHKLRYARKFSRPLVQGSGFNLPFRDDAFSCVVCSQVIEHVPSDAPILEELCRVLAPGGCLILGTPDYDRLEWVAIEKLYGLAAPGGYADEHVTHYTRRGLVDYFQRRGFTVEATRYVLRGELILALRKGGTRSLT